jgi:hypothetical protein
MFFFLLLLLPFFEETPSNYLEYHRSFAEVERLIVEEDFQAASVSLEELFRKYEVVFSKDWVIAAQVHLLNGDEKKAFECMRGAGKKGVPFDCLQSIPLLQEGVCDSLWEVLSQDYESLQETYLASIDRKLQLEFSKRYQEEQQAKQKEGYQPVVYANFKRIQDLTRKNRFPGENRIGIDDSRFAGKVEDCELGNSVVTVTLLHYDYPVRELGLDWLKKAINNGSLHPRDFAAIYTFEVNQVSVLYRDSQKEYPRLPRFYFNFPFGKKSTDLNRVNADRAAWGICSLEVDHKKISIERKYGMKLKFGYR